MIQEEEPVAYASRALTETEIRYSQIEKELLAITFACRKFRDYIYGKEITIETDHEPLITIMKKPLHSAPMRLQRMKLQLQRYNFRLIYKAGKELHIADTLSRAYLPKDDSHEDEEEFEVLELTCVSKRRADQIREAIQESEEQQELMKYILSGQAVVKTCLQRSNRTMHFPMS